MQAIKTVLYRRVEPQTLDERRRPRYMRPDRYETTPRAQMKKAAGQFER